MEITQESLLEALKTVRLPAQKQSVVESGLISRLEIQEKSVFVEYRLAERNSMFEKSLSFQSNKALKALDSSLEIVVDFVESAGDSSAESAKKPPRPAIGSIIAVGSGKGGVGKSSVTVNLAMALKKLKYSVGILDCDLYGPSIPTMLGVEGKKPMMLNRKIQPIEAHGIKLMSAGFFVEEDQGLIWRGPMIHKLIQQFYVDVDWEGTDVLLVDLPPGTGDAPLSLSQTMPLTGSVLVTLPQKISLIDVKRAYAMFRQVNVPILGLIENMSEFVCPECGTHSEIFSRGGSTNFCKETGVPFLGEIPIDPQLREACDRGLPYLINHEGTAVAEAFMRVADSLRSVIRTADELEEAVQIVL
ncbi:MAG: ATP-binding protein [Bradymonadales bacterium]|nr:MAG: ATP-binding protein [Bradymonadales bacterium]